ncbi:hypothetical protein D3C80_1350140 [compost metagenome]
MLSVSTVVTMIALSVMTNLVLNTESSISVLLKSSMGPNTRKVISDPAEKVFTKEDATKASEVEQIEST